MTRRAESLGRILGWFTLVVVGGLAVDAGCYKGDPGYGLDGPDGPDKLRDAGAKDAPPG